MTKDIRCSFCAHRFHTTNGKDLCTNFNVIKRMHLSIKAQPLCERTIEVCKEVDFRNISNDIIPPNFI